MAFFCCCAEKQANCFGGCFLYSGNSDFIFSNAHIPMVARDDDEDDGVCFHADVVQRAQVLERRVHDRTGFL